MRIYITRHGETQWNKEGKMQGWMNSDLSDKGMECAKKTGEFLKNIDFDCIYSSPLGRAYDTALHIRGEKDTPIIEKEYLKEMGFGIWEGMERFKVDEIYADESFLFWNQPHLYTPVKDGEGYTELLKRAEEGFKDILASSVGYENILIVAHAAILKAIFLNLKKLPLEDFWKPPFLHNNCLSILEVTQDGIEFILEGDVSHL